MQNDFQVVTVARDLLNQWERKDDDNDLRVLYYIINGDSGVLIKNCHNRLSLSCPCNNFNTLQRFNFEKKLKSLKIKTL